MTVLTVTFAGNSRVELNDVPIPEPGPGEVLMKVGASAICGSEMKRFRSPEPLASNPGHEIVGTVVDNRGAQGPRVGDRVAANVITGCGHCTACLSGDRRFCPEQGYVTRGHSDFVALPAVCCMPLPDDVPFDEGVLLGGDTLGVAYHAVSKIKVGPRETVAVIGCGPVGLGFVALLSFLGIRTLAVEVRPYRRDLAGRIGADAAIDPTETDAVEAIKEWTGGRGVDVAVDATGTEAGARIGLDATRKQGRFVFAGGGDRVSVNPWKDFGEKETTAYGVWYFVDRDYAEVLDLYRRGLKVSNLITHRFPLAEAQTAYDVFDRGESGKVLFVSDDGPVGERSQS
jgi:threonine dehydrogenase-like Zn-dependent dehydrogenase